MNKIIYTACIGTLALALTAQGAENGGGRKRGNAGGRQSAARATRPAVSQPSIRSSGQVRTQRNFNTVRVRQQSNLAARSDANVGMRRNVVRNNRVNVTNEMRANRLRNRNDVTVNRARNINRTENNVVVNRERNMNRARNINRERNVTRNNFTVNRARNMNRRAAVTNNWRGGRFSGARYSAFRNYQRAYHNRDWYHQNSSRIAFAFGAPYYWSSGYWYPAWGYSPGVNYVYDGPIYGYGNLTPDQVVVNVQTQLANDGYYTGPIDGQMGPMTRQAIANFQADNGLAVTASVDQPTLETLGLA